MTTTLATVFLVLLLRPAMAGAYDDCMLANLRSATVEAAAEGLRLACLNRLTVPLPDRDLQALTGTVTVGPLPRRAVASTAENALYITLHNETGYVIRSLDLSISRSGGRHVDHVPALYGLPGTGPGRLATLGANATGSFYAPIDEPAGPLVWTIVGASGYEN